MAQFMHCAFSLDGVYFDGNVNDLQSKTSKSTFTKVFLFCFIMAVRGLLILRAVLSQHGCFYGEV